MKHLKAFAALLIAAVTLLSFSACNKDEKDANTNTNAPASVADTDWEWYDPDATDVYRVQVEFNGPLFASVIKEGMVDGMMDVQLYMGTYSYSNGSGTLSLEDDNQNPINATFTVDGSRLSITLQGATYNLTKK